jgi:hypothetical protein
MKTKLLLAVLALCFVFQKCENDVSKPTISGSQLANVLNQSQNFRILVDKQSKLFGDLNMTLTSLSNKQFGQLTNIIGGRNIESFVQQASREEKTFMLQFAPTGFSILGSVYEQLINELSTKYVFNEQEVQNAVVSAFNSTSTPTNNGRTMQATCQQQCINSAYNYYWTLYDATHDVDLAMFGSISFEAGCLNGCAYGGGGNP